jgi:YbbR domain-containing protein
VVHYQQQQQQHHHHTPLKIKRRNWFQNLPTKLVALALASLLWLSVAYRIETIQRTFAVPIEYRNLPSNLALDDLHPTQAQVTLVGAERVFDFDSRTMVISLDVSGAKPGWQEFVLSHDNLAVSAGLTIREINPQVITLQVHRLTKVTLPVRVQFEGKLAHSLRLVHVQVKPAEVHLLLPPSALSRLSEVETHPLNLRDVKQTKSIRLPVILPEGAKFLKDAQNTVDVTIQVAKASDTP